jgi:Tol biopolymer transport system component
MSKKKSVLLLTALTLATAPLLVQSSPAYAYIADNFGISPKWEWREIQTEHFILTYPKEMKKVAAKAAIHFEEAYRALSPALYWVPNKKTQVLLYDNSDAANGLASAALRLGIILYIVPPEPWFSTSYYDDWLRLVIFHEYTHFLNMDPSRGFWSGLRLLFGDGTLPNTLWPTWMLEGYAVWNETRWGLAGRGRSPYWQGILRAATEEKILGDSTLVSLDLLNGDTFEFPEGEIPYLYGYELMNQVVRSVPPGRTQTADQEDLLREPSDTLGLLSLRSSRRVPYFLDGNIQNITGKTWSGHWDAWVQDSEKRYQTELHQLTSEKKPDAYRTEQTNFDSLRSIRFSRDGQWVAWLNEGSDRRTGIHVKNLKTGQELRLDDQLLGSSAVFTPDSKTLIVSNAKRQESFFLFGDLFAYDLETGVITRLSNGLRVRDPDISPDGQNLIFSQGDSEGAVHLAQAPLFRNNEGRYYLGEEKWLYRTSFLGRISNARYHPHQPRIVFSEHINGVPQEDLRELDLTSLQVTTVRADGSFNRMPVFHPVTGELFFITNTSGLDTVWKREESSATFSRVAHVTTGLWFPEISPSGDLHVARIGARGWDWVAFPLSELKGTPESEVKKLPPPPAPDSTQVPTQEKTLISEEKIYSPFASLKPRAWIPSMTESGTGVDLSLTAFGFDATDRHAYWATAGYSFFASQPSGSLSYENRLLGATLVLSGRDELIAAAQARQVEGESVDLWSRSRQIGFQAYWPYQLTWSVLTPIVSASLGQDENWIRAKNGDTRRAQATDLTRQAEARLTYDDTEGSSLGISPERGGITSLGTRSVVEDTDAARWKVGLLHRHHFALGLSHHILIPEVLGAWSFASVPGNATGSQVLLTGNSIGSHLLDSLLSTAGAGGTNPLSTINIRGYPGVALAVRGVVQTSLDYRFPLVRVFRGLDTLPWVFRNLSGQIFFENSQAFTNTTEGAFRSEALPSTGAGVNLTSRAFIRVPINLGIQYQHGFNSAQGGQGNWVTALSIGSIF